MLLHELLADWKALPKFYRLATERRLEWLSNARPEQISPPGDWRIWLCLAGRGWGKTRVGSEDMAWDGQVYKHRIAVVAPTFADARDTCAEGESGLLSVIPEENIRKWNRSIGEIELRNGTWIKLFSADEPKRLRGPQFHKAWTDEVAAWADPLTWDMLMFGLRLKRADGKAPSVVATTTPVPTPFVKKLVKSRRLVLSSGSTFDNAANLSQDFLDDVAEKYEGTRLGDQELRGLIIEDTDGALWNYKIIERCRVKETPQLRRIVVAVDPSASSGPKAAETGIVVAGLGVDRLAYVLFDGSLRARPEDWGSAVVGCYDRFDADRVVGEVNNGGDMVRAVIQGVRDTVPFTPVTASRGKITRAEPISNLYAQGRVKHLGVFRQLESQMTTYIPGEPSPDRMDALVWAITELMIGPGKAKARGGAIVGAEAGSPYAY